MSSYYSEEHRRYSFGFGNITYAVQLLILANTLVFCMQLLVDVPFGGTSGAPPGGWILDWIDFGPDEFLNLHLWGVFTYMFVHGGLMHLFQNMLTLFFAGPEVERALGSRQFFRFYLFCGVFGALANFVPLIAFGGPSVPVIGASGATLGILVAFAMIDPDRQFFMFPIPFPITVRGLVLVIIALNLATALTGGGAISVATHFGGMAAGYSYMKLRPRFAYWQLQRRIKRREDPSAPNLPPEEEEKLAEAIDNIFKFQDRDRK